MKKFYILRHGETDWNRVQRMQGHEDIPLNDNGRLQAQNAGNAVAALQISACYASDLSRAYETAQLALTRHPVIATPIAAPDLRERHYGRMSGMTPDEVAADRAQNPHLYQDYGDRHFPHDGEAPDVFSARVRNAIMTKLSRHDAPVLIVSHGGVIREIMRSFIKMAAPPKPGNCHLYELAAQNDDWQIARIWPQ